MNPQAKSGHDYKHSYLCKRPGCHRVRAYGYRGFCQFHFDAYQRALLASGQLLGRGRVDAAPVAAHIERLREAGMELKAIARRSGVTKVTLHRISKQEMVCADTAARVMRVRT